MTPSRALTHSARNTWFALLGVLVFVAITLMGVKHIDFYGVDRATKLPLADVFVPTRSFFVAAPILTSAIYGYFHLYLIRRWDALSNASAQINRPAPWRCHTPLARHGFCTNRTGCTQGCVQNRQFPRIAPLDDA